MDYGNILYGQPKNDTFSEKLESVQYKGTLLIAGTIHRTSWGKTLRNWVWK